MVHLWTEVAGNEMTAMQPLPPDPAPTAVPSKKKATLTRLLKEARLAFSEKGVAGAKVEDIARAAGVTKQLVYHYFSSKEQLFVSVLDESTQEVLADLLALELDHLSPTEALRTLLRHVFDLFRSDPTRGSLTHESSRFHEHNVGYRKRIVDLAPILISMMSRILQRGAASGEFVPEVDAKMFCTAAILMATSGFTNRYIASSVTGFDTMAPEGMLVWQAFATDFVLATVLAGHRPALQPQTPTPPTDSEG